MGRDRKQDRRNGKTRNTRPPAAPQSSRAKFIIQASLIVVLLALIGGMAWMSMRSTKPTVTTGNVGPSASVIPAANATSLHTDFAVEPRTLNALLDLPVEQLDQVDIARMNLLCATGLPGAEKLDIDQALATLDRWAEKVKFETERHLYRLTDPRFKDHAEHYQHSEARFRAEWLVYVLQQDIGLHYHAGFVPQDQAVPPFKTSKETFIHGLVDNEDAHKAFGGNCVSLPVAYAAVGRRLGYPIKLVAAKEHMFSRWEGIDHPNPAWRERFNFDGAGKGFSIDPDEFYLTWPSKSYPDQVKMCGWLESLTPQEELSVFMASRGAVLAHVNEDYGGALVALAHSARLRPTSSQSVERIRVTLEDLYKEIVDAHPDAYRQMVARIQERNRPESVPWWKTEAGRAAQRAEIERINEINRRNMERLMQPMQPPQPPTRTQPPGW